MEKKTTTIKLRISEKDLDKLNKCSEFMGKTKSEIIRLGIEKLFNENKIVSSDELAYAEETLRKVDNSRFEINVFSQNELIERLIQDIDVNDDEERYDEAKNIINTIDERNKYISEYSYTDEFETIYRKATQEEIDKEIENRKNSDKEAEMFLNTPFMNSLMDSFR